MVGVVGLLGLAWQSPVGGHPDSQPSHLDPSPTQSEKWGPTQPGCGLWGQLHRADVHGSFLNSVAAISAIPSGPHSVNELLFFSVLVC